MLTFLNHEGISTDSLAISNKISDNRTLFWWSSWLEAMMQQNIDAIDEQAIEVWESEFLAQNRENLFELMQVSES